MGACSLLVSDDAVGQIFFVVIILTFYNTALVLLLPWRFFEINVLEFSMTVLLLIMLLSQNILNDAPAYPEQFKRIFITFFVMLACAVVVYVLRVCIGSVLAKSNRSTFVGFPRPF